MHNSWGTVGEMWLSNKYSALYFWLTWGKFRDSLLNLAIKVLYCLRTEEELWVTDGQIIGKSSNHVNVGGWLKTRFEVKENSRKFSSSIDLNWFLPSHFVFNWWLLPRATFQFDFVQFLVPFWYWNPVPNVVHHCDESNFISIKWS